MIDRTAMYRLVAWTVGAQHVALGALVVSNAGVDDAYASAAACGAGEKCASRGLHRSRAQARARRDAGAAAHLAVDPRRAARCCAARLAAAAHAAQASPRTALREGAFANAKRDFARIDALALIDAGERGRYVACTWTCCANISLRASPTRRFAHARTELLAALAGRCAGAAARASCRCSRQRTSIKFADRARDATRVRASSQRSRGGSSTRRRRRCGTARVRGQAAAGRMMDLIELPAIDFAAPYVLLLLLLHSAAGGSGGASAARRRSFSRARTCSRAVRRGGAFDASRCWRLASRCCCSPG